MICEKCETENITYTGYKSDNEYQMICRECGHIWWEQMYR